MFFVQMSGFPGSGKSTLARRIGNVTGAIVIDHDIVKSALLESMDDLKLDNSAAGQASYHIEWSLIDFHLSQGQSVIFDSPCFYTEMIEKGLSLSTKHHAQYKYIECYLNNYEEINKRLTSRKPMMTQILHAGSEEMFRKAIDNSKRPEAHPYLVVDSSRQVDQYIDEVIEYILKE